MKEKPRSKRRDLPPKPQGSACNSKQQHDVAVAME
jgi:hypothetical protein